MTSELRRSPRFPFFAAVEIVDTASTSAMNARTSEICRHGCYLDMMNPFHEGTPLRIRITHQGRAVDASARVVHSQPNVGMGVSFDQLAPGQETIIEEWLSAQ
jgi:PilZ domain